MLLKLLLLRFCNVDIYFYTHFVITQNVFLYFLLQSVTPITTFKRKITIYNEVVSLLTLYYFVYVAHSNTEINSIKRTFTRVTDTWSSFYNTCRYTL